MESRLRTNMPPVKASFLAMTQSHAKDNNQMQASFATLLSGAAEALANYLDRLLPSLLDNWWKNAVVDKLSFQQQRRIKQKGIVHLSSLDLAALLRVLDQNWYQISMKMNLSPEVRHFVKEMQTVRNRWAHAGSEGFPVDDVYRDLDTLQRFATVIEADEALLQEVRWRVRRRHTTHRNSKLKTGRKPSPDSCRARNFIPTSPRCKFDIRDSQRSIP